MAGRPTKYKPEYAEQASKLCALGATDAQLADFFESNPSEDDFYVFSLDLIKADKNGVIAARKKARAKWRKSAATPESRLIDSVRSRMWSALKGKTTGKLFARLQYGVEELMIHLEERFQPGMSWENYGAWHVDHVKPCALFDQMDEIQFLECWALGNLQPLWATDNCKKGAKYGPA